jgi:hypothetical protein
MKKSKVVIKASKLVELDGTKWYQCDATNSLFHQNPKKGKTLPKTELITLSKKSTLNHAYTGKGQLHSCHQVTVKQMEDLVKLAKTRQKEFKDGVFFLHLSPDLSFFFAEPKKK